MALDLQVNGERRRLDPVPTPINTGAGDRSTCLQPSTCGR